MCLCNTNSYVPTNSNINSLDYRNRQIDKSKVEKFENTATNNTHFDLFYLRSRFVYFSLKYKPHPDMPLNQQPQPPA